jgi:hypothetical protein
LFSGSLSRRRASPSLTAGPLLCWRSQASVIYKLDTAHDFGVTLCANEDETSAHQEFRLEGAEG